MSVAQLNVWVFVFQMELVESNKDSPLPSPTALLVVSVCERKKRRKTKTEFSVGVIPKADVRNFSLFLKEKCISSLFRTNYIEKNFNLHICFFFPSFHEHCLSYHALPTFLKLLVLKKELEV